MPTVVLSYDRLLYFIMQTVVLLYDNLLYFIMTDCCTLL